MAHIRSREATPAEEGGRRGRATPYQPVGKRRRVKGGGRREGQKEEVPILVPIVPFLPSLLRSFLDGREGVSRDRP